MAKCRYHFRTEAVERCPLCGVALCEECARPRKCPNCGKSKVVEKRQRVPLCTNHPDLASQGECPGCGKPFCPACFHSSGFCPPCAQERLTAVRRPPERPAKKRKSRRTGSSLKRSRNIGWLVVCALLFVFGSWVWGNFSRLFQVWEKQMMKQAALHQQMKKMSKGNAGGINNPDDVEGYLEKFEKNANKKGQQDQTEKLMAQLQGENAPAEESGVQARLPGKVEAILRKNAAKSTKIWKFSDHRVASRRIGHVVGSAAQWKVMITSPAAGQTVSGTVTVCAQLDAANSVNRAELQVDGKMDAVSDRPPFRFDWATEGYSNGQHSIRVMVTDAEGGTHASAGRTLHVKN
ncbi:MAG TPA: hypothetical protein DD435_06015 [Cyanobacteria bacterium UBA8530]|nr:hypothetical protein [Cyanobacteria bacterium UBA8530]